MKKKKNNKTYFFTCLIIILILLFFQPICTYVISLLGQINYNQKNYEQSAKYYCLVTRIDRSKYSYSYYCVNSLKHLPMNYNTQKEIYDISMQNQAGAARIIANETIAAFRDRILEKYEPNYIDKVFSYRKIIRWNKKSFPLKIYFVDDNMGLIPEYYEKNIMAAFDTWDKVSGNILSFVKTNDIKNADIIIDFNADESDELMQECMGDQCFISLATTTPVLNYNMLKKMMMEFNIKGFDNQYISEKQIYRVALHEIGHAIGLLGHSENPNDLMYMSDKDVYLGVQNISQRDINTMKLLYQIAPDLTDVPLDEVDLSKYIYSPIILGAIKQINIGEYNAAATYIKKAPTSVNGWIDLAGIYFDAKEYDKALRSTLRAEEFARTQQEYFLCYYNMGLIYNAMEKYDTALEYSKKAVAYDKTADSAVLLAGIYCNMGNWRAAQNILENMLPIHPDNIEAVDLLTTVYVKQGNIIKAAKVLKTFKQQNPDININETFGGNKTFIIFLSNFV